MDVALYFSAFTIGFLGSFHCAGMCGPIALLLPQNQGSQAKMLTGRFLYNAGRVFTYAVIGLLFGMFGWAAALKGFQRELSVLTGVVIAVTVLLTAGTKQRVQAYSMTSSYTSPIRKALKKLFSVKSYFSLFLIGVLNGLLPCGFVYLAIAGAVSTGSLAGSVIYMSLFGLGTFPMMMSLSVAASFLGQKFRNVYTKAAPLISIGLAIFLIYRGTDMKTEACVKTHKISEIHCAVPK